MKLSTTYLFYLTNKPLERALADTAGALGDAATPDNEVTVADIFLHTRGNFEQYRFNSGIYETLQNNLEATLTKEFHEQDPAAWARTQNHLGNILAALGQQQRDAELYKAAIQCFRHALEEFDQDSNPLDWATTQYNLGTAKQALGRQQDDSKLLKESIDAYTQALLVWSRKETPEEWAYAMHQLGATFHAQGKLHKGNRIYQKSVVAYKNALAVLDADNYPFELTATHNNRGAVLHHLGESEENPERLDEAIKAYQKAWTVSMEQQLPFHLAVICRVNKATAQNVLAELTNDRVLADEVGDEFELILECFPHALQPLARKHCEEQRNKAQSRANA